MNPSELRRLILRLILAPVIGLALLAIILGVSIWRLENSSRWVDRTDRVIAAADQLEKLIDDEETGVRGFLLVRNGDFVEQWRAGQIGINRRFDEIAAMITDNPAQEERLVALRQRHQRWESLTAERILHPASEAHAQALDNRQQMDALRTEMDSFRRGEERLREERLLRNREDLHLLYAITGGLSMVAAALLAFWIRRGVLSLDQTYQQQFSELDAQRQTLSESEARFRQLADAMPQIVFAAQPNGHVDYYNQRWYDFTGLPRDTGGDEGWQPIIHPDDSQRALDAWEAAVGKEETYEIEHRFWDWREKGWRWFLARALPVRDARDKVVRWFGTCTDINRQKQTEEALTQAEERIRVALKSVPLVLSSVDRELRYRWIYQPHSDFMPEQVIGLRDDEIAGLTGAAEAMEFKRSVLERSVAGRRELRFTMNGVHRIYDMSVEPMRDSEGDVIGLTVAALDITQRAAAEEERELLLSELREKNELMEVAQAAANAGFWQYRPKTRECYLTDGTQRMFNLYSKARVDVEEWLDRIHLDDRAGVRKALQEALTGTETFHAEYRVPDSAGKVRWISSQARLLTDYKGEPYMVGINVDITAQKQADEALQRAEKLAVVGRLAASISHEINNPLEAVTNLLYLLQTEVSPEQQKQYAKLAQEELARVSHIVTHTLRFHRQATSARGERLSTLLESAAAIYQGRLISSAIDLRKDYAEQQVVNCFAGELRQVFANLIGNSFDATRKGGTIVLKTRDATDWRTGQTGVRVVVADTGIGMDPKTIKRLFEPFFTTKGIQGTGLGLWISADILKKHHATLQVKSRQSPEDQSGTVFSIFFPLHGADAGADENASAATK